ncbi:HlyD family efflux transporter periplasmic adaptor subunit [Chlorobium phaeobacteroides]|jgi:protease secretion system membrane fusion protein|uniref:Secretion protein HlyD family protein n=1 Tax=Chlorobium phaeobacteroides (strain DSM 266 / SMG 266 / 2430) TaxID=290317 RepID=A1BH87_CHLPD|nr:HlyD family efflux transporter periplasmic adaptor subunit [Chlorobium phaeobacteroides]ABL65764.1 secretion protein HlyD family protein [Chlorobium phaeobacteroides DSM 266]MBV5326105.1 HlyD family efflux transporter periplasmic adaptor subunit [Chlorobium sp.]
MHSQKEEGEKQPVATEKAAEVHVKSYRDTGSTIRLGIWILLVGFGGFLLWAAFAPLDEGVPCQGVVSIATKRKVVEHLRGGTVEKVEVREGQIVQEGEVLMRLDSQTARARYDEIHQHYIGTRATADRLLAEMSGAGSIAFHHDLLADPDRTLAEQNMRTQRQLFLSRQVTLRILNEQLSGIVSLVKEGYAPLSQQHELELKIAELKSATASQLAQVQLEVEADAEKTRALAEELADTELRSPASGQVVGLQVQTVGAVIQPGQKVMDIVPLHEGLLIDAKVAPHLIDSIRKGLPVDVSFSSFAHAPQLVVQAVVASISKDIITDPQTNPSMPGASYYLARIAVTPHGLNSLGNRQMQPGMPVQVVIKTGERSLLTYLIDPLLKRITVSMKEE